MGKLILPAILCCFLACPCLAADNEQVLNVITRVWVDKELEEIDKFVAQCGEGTDCGQEVEKKYSNVCDLLTKKIFLMCQEKAGEKAAACQKQLGSLLEANTNARMEAGKLQRYLYPNLEEDILLQRIFASDMALLGAYIDTLSVMLEK